MFGTDASGAARRPITTPTAAGLAVRPAGTRDVVFDFQAKTAGVGESHLLFDCMVDPRDQRAERDEGNNRFGFLFRAYCRGDDDPCPGPVQHGAAVSYAPLEA